MAISHEHGHLTELRFDPNSPVAICWPADFNARCTPVVRHDLSSGEFEEGANEWPDGIFRHVYAVFRDSTERRIGWCSRMPVKLHVDTPRPLNDCVSSDRIIERGYDNVRSG